MRIYLIDYWLIIRFNCVFIIFRPFPREASEYPQVEIWLPTNAMYLDVKSKDLSWPLHSIPLCWLPSSVPYLLSQESCSLCKHAASTILTRWSSRCTYNNLKSATDRCTKINTCRFPTHLGSIATPHSDTTAGSSASKCIPLVLTQVIFSASSILRFQLPPDETTEIPAQCIMLCPKIQMNDIL